MIRGDNLVPTSWSDEERFVDDLLNTSSSSSICTQAATTSTVANSSSSNSFSSSEIIVISDDEDLQEVDRFPTDYHVQTRSSKKKSTPKGIKKNKRETRKSSKIQNAENMKHPEDIIPLDVFRQFVNSSKDDLLHQVLGEQLESLESSFNNSEKKLKKKARKKFNPPTTVEFDEEAIRVLRDGVSYLLIEKLKKTKEIANAKNLSQALSLAMDL
ncbi:predicted protein [Naegleria gruberi]|uniref:Predicted protein n=1 Tax=Naegleria gruberi TaxID=5762 RepID=D2VNV7_NAEGR|nr:uncharacterized protein NAEGRDRAFT_51091 [Naegleria gruberi]EFC41485.1 predicted protein [Naegleria gruberi]|eukprot:XP_002674229.1 predicted protein [Naegleria gruberi strain NEG-M]